MASKDINMFRIIVGLAMVPVLVMFQSFVATDLWLWFIVPLGVAKVGMAHMYGIMLVVRVATEPSAKSSEGDYDSMWTPVFASLFGSLFVWAIAAVTHSCM